MVSMLIPFVLDRYGDRIAKEIDAVLTELGEERVRSMVENGVSLWQALPDKETVTALAEPYIDVIGHLDLRQVAHKVYEILREHNSPFAFITEEWLLLNLREARREIMSNVVE